MRTRFLLLFSTLAMAASAQPQQPSFTLVQGALVRGDSTQKAVALVFTADEAAEGLTLIRQTLQEEKIQAGFFFTGRFYRNKAFEKEVKALQKAQHYLGPHSDQHLLYCDWTKRNSLLVSRDSFTTDIRQNLAAMQAAGLSIHSPQLFIPPYEWWNDSIAAWSRAAGLRLINFTPGMRTNADYTWPALGTAYKSSQWILAWLQKTLNTQPEKFQGAILLVHAGTDERRKDKLYRELKTLVAMLRAGGFRFKRIDALLAKK